MSSQKTIINKIILYGVIFAIVMTGCITIQNSCFASEPSVTPYYEKITKQYPSMEQYVANARKNIKDNWYPSSASFENSATLVLKIKNDGELLDSFISTSSGNESFDNSLIEAAKKTKFMPLPNDVNEDSVDIDMSFKMQRRNILNKFNK